MVSRLRLIETRLDLAKTTLSIAACNFQTASHVTRESRLEELVEAAKDVVDVEKAFTAELDNASDDDLYAALFPDYGDTAEPGTDDKAA